MKLNKHYAYPLTFAVLTLATSWSLGLAAPTPAPADFWVRDKLGRITHACTATEPLVICLRGRTVVMQVQSDLTNGFPYAARCFNPLSDVEKKKGLSADGRESSPKAVITNLKGVRL
jgi:hypothetical protein